MYYRHSQLRVLHSTVLQQSSRENWLSNFIQNSQDMNCSHFTLSLSCFAFQSKHVSFNHMLYSVAAIEAN